MNFYSVIHSRLQDEEGKELCGIIFTNNTKRITQVEEMEKSDKNVEQPQQGPAAEALQPEKPEIKSIKQKNQDLDDEILVTIRALFNDIEQSKAHIEEKNNLIQK